MSTDSVRPETLAGDPLADAALREAIREDEQALGRPHRPGEREAFSAGFRERYEEHHAVPRCLLRLHDEANAGDLDGAGIEAWLEFEHECMRWGVDVEIGREDLGALIEASVVALPRDEHRCLHESDFASWGRRGGLATLRRYGTSWYSALALKRWGRLDAEGLNRARVIGHGLPIKDDAEPGHGG